MEASATAQAPGTLLNSRSEVLAVDPVATAEAVAGVIVFGRPDGRDGRASVVGTSRSGLQTTSGVRWSAMRRCSRPSLKASEPGLRSLAPRLQSRNGRAPDRFRFRRCQPFAKPPRSCRRILIGNPLYRYAVLAITGSAADGQHGRQNRRGNCRHPSGDVPAAIQAQSCQS